LQHASSSPTWRQRTAGILRDQGILVAFIVLMVVMSLSIDRFATSENLLAVIRQVSILGTIALGVTFVVIGGNLDLSVGSMLSLTTVVVVDLHDKIGPGPAIAVALVVALLAGAVNGTLVGFFRLNSLIVTLGMLSVLQGATLLYSGGKNVDIANQEDTWFAIFGRGRLISAGGIDINVPVVLFLGLAVILGIVLHRTSFGRKVFAVGGNRVAAAYTGLRASRIVFTTYLISAFSVFAGAVILGSRVMGSQNTVGQTWELQVLAGIILGGTSLLGGSGSIFKTVIGVLIFGFINNGLLLLGFPFYAQWIVTWIVIILVVWLDVAAKRGRLWAA
jgi:ribose/xylose/arabinose/galactoside ABC-type transport system permease subunit